MTYATKEPVIMCDREDRNWSIGQRVVWKRGRRGEHRVLATIVAWRKDQLRDRNVYINLDPPEPMPNWQAKYGVAFSRLEPGYPLMALRASGSNDSASDGQKDGRA